MKAVLPALARPLLESQLPHDLEVAWWSSPADAKEMIGDAEIVAEPDQDGCRGTGVVEFFGHADNLNVQFLIPLTTVGHDRIT